MDSLLHAARSDLLNPKTPIGAGVWSVVFLCATTVMAAVIRRFARRIESRLSSVMRLD